MTIELNWKIGFEVELIAPIGKTRKDLADTLARKTGGSVNRFFHPQSEPSKVQGHPTFENLTQGFELLDSSNQWIASFVDDLTLQRDFKKQTPSKLGWYRIIADDGRLLSLIRLNCDPNAGAASVLEPIAKLFATKIHSHESRMFRVSDDRGVSVAICAPLPGERERPCEIVTAPIDASHQSRLALLLQESKSQGFTLPQEGATHVHFDAEPLCSSQTITNLVRLFEKFGRDLKHLVGVNRHCVRLGPWPKQLRQLTESDHFADMSWPDAREALAVLPLTKYCDFNLLNIAKNNVDKHTFEIRILPSTLCELQILYATALFEGLIRICCHPPTFQETLPDSLDELLAAAPISSDIKGYWLNKIRNRDKLVKAPPF